MWSGPVSVVSLGLILATTLRLGRLIIPKLHTKAPGSKQGRGMFQITPLAHSRAEVYSQVCGHLCSVGRKAGGRAEPRLPDESRLQGSWSWLRVGLPPALDHFCCLHASLAGELTP